ncbi:MAG: hypothetical protein V4488_19465 [Pseudomonadota bacterium]
MHKVSPVPKTAWPYAQPAGKPGLSPVEQAEQTDQPEQMRIKRVLEHDTAIPGIVARVVEFDRKFSDTPYRESRNKRRKQL